jgi:hypothetical protein
VQRERAGAGAERISRGRALDRPVQGGQYARRGRRRLADACTTRRTRRNDLMPLRRGRCVHGRWRRRRGRPGHGGRRFGDGGLVALSLAVVATTAAALRIAGGRDASEGVDVAVGVFKELIIAERSGAGRAGSGLWRGEQIDGSRAETRRTSSTAIACASGRSGTRALPSRSSMGGSTASASALARA